jgi:uncharacterized membrane protein YccC
VGNLIVMGTTGNAVPNDLPPPVFDRGSREDTERQIAYLLFDIRNMIQAMSTIKPLDDARKVQDERIMQLLERAVRTETNLSNLEKIIDRNNVELKTTADRHHADLDGLGTRHNKDTSELKNDLNDLGRQLERQLNEATQRIETSMNQMGRRLEDQIREPDRIAHTVASFGKFALAVIAGGGLTELLRILITHHW